MSLDSRCSCGDPKGDRRSLLRDPLSWAMWLLGFLIAWMAAIGIQEIRHDDDCRALGYDSAVVRNLDLGDVYCQSVVKVPLDDIRKERR